MNAKRLRNLLVEAEILSSFDYGPGFPGLLPYGLEIVERLQRCYLDVLAAEFEVSLVSSPILCDLDDYRQAFGASYQYQNVFRLALAQRRQESVVRPDSLAWMLGHHRDGARTPALVCLEPLFRAETADPQPLVRDKHIWGTVQMVQRLGPGEGDRALERHADCFLRMMTDLRLPTVTVEAPPLRHHARRRLLTFSMTADGRAWLTSTLYLLDERLVRQMRATGDVVELGFTPKLIALSCALHADGVGLCLPRRLTSGTVVMSARRRARQPAATLKLVGGAVGRIESSDLPWPKTVRLTRRRGLPVALRIGPDGDPTHLYGRAQDRYQRVAAEVLGERVAAVMDRHDQLLWERALAAHAPLFSDAPAAIHAVPSHLGDPGREFVLGRLVKANFEQGQAAARRDCVLTSRKQRFY